MRFTESSFEYIPRRFENCGGIESMFKMIELAARTCYKTEDLITENSYDKIINKILIPKGHTSPLEFGTCHLFRSFTLDEEIDHKWIDKYYDDRYSRVEEIWIDDVLHVYVTTTFRTILQGNYKDPIEAIKNNFDKDWKDDMYKYWSEPMQYHHRRYCYRFVMDRIGSQSCQRHRGNFGISYAQESTRYVNYNRDKFEHEITICLPSKFYQLIDEWSKSSDSLTGESYSWLNDASIEDKLNFLRCNDRGWCAYEDSLKKSEDEYMYLVGEEGWKPEDARGVLPVDIKTEFLMCGYEEDWNMFLFRRTDKHAHPHIQMIAKELEKDFRYQVEKDYKETCE